MVKLTWPLLSQRFPGKFKGMHNFFQQSWIKIE